MAEKAPKREIEDHEMAFAIEQSLDQSRSIIMDMGCLLANQANQLRMVRERIAHAEEGKAEANEECLKLRLDKYQLQAAIENHASEKTLLKQQLAQLQQGDDKKARDITDLRYQIETLNKQKLRLEVEVAQLVESLKRANNREATRLDYRIEKEKAAKKQHLRKTKH